MIHTVDSRIDYTDKRTPFCSNRLSLRGGSMYSEAFLYALCIKLRILIYKNILQLYWKGFGYTASHEPDQRMTSMEGVVGFFKKNAIV